jgi:Tol biopolymer transport system component
VSWSPDGERLIFRTVLDEEFNSNYYLVDLQNRTRRALLRNTSIDIEEWR